jgi:hypothetical protein
MQATKAAEQRQDSLRQGSNGKHTKLDDRYGKIGISAVAAAVCHKGERRERRAIGMTPAERD